MNEEIQENGKNNGHKVKTVIIVLLVIALLLFIGFIIYDKVISKDNNTTNTGNNNSNNTSDVVELDINSSEIQELTKFVRGFDNIHAWGIYGTDTLMAAFDLNNTNRDKMMTLISTVLEPTWVCDGQGGSCENKCLVINGENKCGYVDQKSMENKFREVFGPDVSYTNGTFEAGNSCSIAVDYDSKTQKYWASNECGGGKDLPEYNELYRAEQKGDEIYTYWYFYKTFDTVFYTDLGDQETWYLSIIDANGVKHKIDIGDNKAKEEFNKLKTIMDLKTYKITYKKQSDGKYYVYSGEWM
ncbi:MAG: hypothetical protein NC181_05140 [Clostridium sp.]|nr:hypothetical protein [Clostridium sp.]MCM1444638.1 hypothetical protein [Candidatus Amulumruptor caecigallinarius]